MNTKLALVIALAAMLPLTATAQAFLTNGLVAYYPFNGNANDESGNGIHGVQYGTTPTTDRHGIQQAAMYFDASNQNYIDCGAPVLLQFTDNFTFTAWVTFDGGAGNPRVVSNGADCGYELLTGESTSVRHFGVNHGCIKFTTQPTYANDGWHFVALKRVGSFAHVFVDGMPIASNPIATPVINGNLNFGRKSLQGAGLGGYWGGKIDDARFYNRALSDGELAAIYTLEAPAQITIAVSQVRLCWPAAPDVTYQVQYRSQLTTNLWVDLGSPIVGTGTNLCITDDVAGPQKFYRLQIVE